MATLVLKFIRCCDIFVIHSRFYIKGCLWAHYRLQVGLQFNFFKLIMTLSILKYAITSLSKGLGIIMLDGISDITLVILYYSISLVLGTLAKNTRLKLDFIAINVLQCCLFLEFCRCILNMHDAVCASSAVFLWLQ